jgi:hypothetical protein
MILILPLLPAKAGTHSQEKKELDSRFRGNERAESAEEFR